MARENRERTGEEKESRERTTTRELGMHEGKPNEGNEGNDRGI